MAALLTAPHPAPQPENGEPQGKWKFRGLPQSAGRLCLRPRPCAGEGLHETPLLARVQALGVSTGLQGSAGGEGGSSDGTEARGLCPEGTEGTEDRGWGSCHLGGVASCGRRLEFASQLSKLGSPGSSGCSQGHQGTLRAEEGPGRHGGGGGGRWGDPVPEKAVSPEAGKGRTQDPPLEPPGASAAHTLTLAPGDPWTVREHDVAVLRHWVCGDLLQEWSETKTLSSPHIPQERGQSPRPRCASRKTATEGSTEGPEGPRALLAAP